GDAHAHASQGCRGVWTAARVTACGCRRTAGSAAGTSAAAGTATNRRELPCGPGQSETLGDDRTCLICGCCSRVRDGTWGSDSVVTYTDSRPSSSTSMTRMPCTPNCAEAPILLHSTPWPSAVHVLAKIHDLQNHWDTPSATPRQAEAGDPAP